MPPCSKEFTEMLRRFHAAMGFETLAVTELPRRSHPESLGGRLSCGRSRAWWADLGLYPNTMFSVLISLSQLGMALLCSVFIMLGLVICTYVLANLV